MAIASPVDLSASLSSIGDANAAQTAAALKIKSKAKGAAQDFARCSSIRCSSR
jgi:hypothetical protein